MAALLQRERVSVAARRQLLIYLALPLAYVICGRLGLALAVPPGYATAVFLPAGIAVGAMFIAGAATLPGTFLGSFLLNVWTGYAIVHQLDATGAAAAFIIAFASMLQAALGGGALRRLIGYPAPFDRPRDLLLLFLLSPLVCLVSATLSLSGMWGLGVVQAADLSINWMTWWVGDALGVLVALPLMLVIAGEPRELWRSRIPLVAVPMLLCFALFVAIFMRVTKWENEDSLLEFRMHSQRVTDVMRATLDEQALLLEQLSKVAGGPNLTRQDFHELVQPLLQRFPTIQAVEWAPRVEAAERAGFEAAQQAAMPGFLIRERDASGQLRPVSDRNQFYPVTYLDPLAGNEQALGFDLASSPERRAAVETAIAAGTPTATAPVRLVQERGEQAGLLLVHAVSGRSTAGVVLIVLRMGTFAGTLAEPLAPTLQLRLVDAAAAQPMFTDFSAATNPVFRSSFEFGARQYLVEAVPSPVYLARHRAWQSWAVLAAGVLGTGLLGALLILGTGHTYRLKTLATELRQNEALLRAREAELEIIINRTPFMLTRCRSDLRYLFVSDGYAAMIGRRPEEIAGKPIVEVIGAEGFKTILPHVQKVLRGDRAEYESDVYFQGIGTRSLQVVYTPERDEQGSVNGWIASILDVTERKQAEEALRAREAELDTIVKRTPFILIRCSPDLHYQFVSEAYAQMIGRRPEEIIGKSLPEVIGEEGFRTVRPYINKVLAGERVEYESEVTYQRVGKRFLHGVYMPEKDEHGNVIGWIASIADITERKRAESQRDLLLAELSHRVKNTLATVISIAHQSFSKAPSIEKARRSFDDRIRALAQTHARLAEANWSGVSLEAVIRDETAPYQDGGRNVLIAGPHITLNPRTAVGLGMAIHELTTNAAKYGALSSKAGTLKIAWQTAGPDNEVQLTWTESGGPSVSPPEHSGFGRTLLERALGADLNGSVNLEFAREGLRCLISFPLDRPSLAPVESIVAQKHVLQKASAVLAAPVSSEQKPANPMRILIVEDETLLAMELEELLQGAGYSVIGPFADLAQATRAAHDEAIDIAVLDINLNGEMVYPLADDLSARGIPFVFTTGYNASNLPERFRGAPRVAKPYDLGALTRELERSANAAPA